MKNERDRIVETYCQGQSFLNFASLSSKKKYERLNFFSDTLTPFERPDMYALCGDTIVGIEHFEFDSSKHEKRGSTAKKEESKDKKKFDDYFSEQKRDGELLSGTIEQDCTIKYYVGNFLSIFRKHYKKIPEYKSNLKMVAPKAKKTLCGFFIEDVTILGDFAIQPDEKKILWPFMVKEICTALGNYPNLDFLIFAMQYCEQDMIFVIRKDLPFLLQKAIPMKDIDFFAFPTPHSLGTRSLGFAAAKK